jgi:hypothetical protein
VLANLPGSSEGKKKDVEKAIKVIHGAANESGLEPDCIEVLMDYVLGKEGIVDQLTAASQKPSLALPCGHCNSSARKK